MGLKHIKLSCHDTRLSSLIYCIVGVIAIGRKEHLCTMWTLPVLAFVQIHEETRSPTTKNLDRSDFRTIQKSILISNERGSQYGNTFKAKTNNNNDDDRMDDQQQQPGMADAFRQFKSLKSLDDPEEYIPAPEKINVDAILADSSNILSSAATTSISPETDFATYRNMMLELEENEIAESYTEVLDELGGSTLQTDDTYSQIITELGGTKSTSSQSSSTSNKIPNDEIIVVDSTSNIGSKSVSNEQFFEDALKEALNDVKLNNPQLSTNKDSILNDKEIMREIENIFDRGNQQLMESLEEIRREQQVLASSNVDSQRTQSANDSATAERLQNAERNMKTILERVDVETANLERAVGDLTDANTKIENDFMWKLKKGGIPKQAALVGFLLLSTWSIYESIIAVTSSYVDSETHLYKALIEGILAMVCAAVFFLL